MMKRKVIILMLVGMFCLIACSQPLDDQPNDTPIQEEQNDPDESYDKEEDDQEQVTDLEDDDSEDNNLDVKDTKTPETPAESVVITVYSSNEDATAFASEEVQLSERSPQAVLSALADKGVVPSDIEVCSFQTAEVDGIASIEIDFNNAFASYVMSTGSTGEYYIIGGVCNTFLEAYGCEQIKITVEGATLETGHKDYPGYMNTFS